MGFAVMLARQRSGSGALGELLGLAGAVEYCDEILLPHGAFRPQSFYHFLARQAPVRSTDDLCTLFQRYLDMRDTCESVALLDIKVAQLRSFAPSYWPVHDRPWILDAVLQRGAKIIRLYRRNLVDQWVSGLLASANQVWHATPDSMLPVRRVHVDRYALVHFIDSCRHEDAAVDAALAGHGPVLSTAYETIFRPAGDGLNVEECRRIVDFLGMTAEPDAFRTPYVKQSAWRLADKVENYDEIADLERMFA